MAKPNKPSTQPTKGAPIQNLPSKPSKDDGTDKVKGGATTEGVKKTMQTQV